MTNPYENVDISELKERYTVLVERYVTLAVELAPKIEKFGKYRHELQHIVNEFVRRGVDIKDPEPLESLVKKEIEKREQNNAERKAENIREGLTEPIENPK